MFGTAVTMVLLVALWVLPSEALAQDVDLPLELTARSAVVAGKGRPCIKLKATGPVRKVKLIVARQGKRRTFKVARMRSGQKRKFCWREKAGMYEYAVGLVALHRGQMRTKELTLSINYLPPIKLILDQARTSMEKRTLVVLLNHPADRAELVIRGEGGKVLANEEAEFAAAAPGSALEISWGKLKVRIVRMDLKVFDTDGFWVGTSISPWSIFIPHDEVAFATDKWAIQASEAPKLDAAVKQINKALRQHASKLRVRLYVAGFTDTVGSGGHNRTLSTNRARAIARYFRKHGVKIAIHFRGYGEEALAKGTPDNTAEPKNRRAVYVLSSQAPVLSRHVKWGGWKEVQ